MFREIVQKQRDFFRSGATGPVSFRLEKLRLLQEAVIGRSREIEKALAGDLKRNGFESFLAEEVMTLSALKTALKKTPQWAAPKKIKASRLNFRSSDRLAPEPLGLSLVISPWNYPLLLALGPLIAAMSAGNCCIVKPSNWPLKRPGFWPTSSKISFPRNM